MTTVTLTYHQQILKSKDEQHQSEIHVLERKIQKFKQAADDRRKELFEELNRGDRLAKSLGFTNIHDAQCAIDTVDDDVSFVECYNQLHQLEAQVDIAQKEEQIWRIKSSQLEQENSTLHAQIKDLQLLKDNLLNQLEDLGKRYDTLKDAKKRATDFYKADYRKWSRFKNWFEHSDHAWNEPGITPEERKKREQDGVAKKKATFLKMGLDSSTMPTEAFLDSPPPPPLGGTEMEKVDDITPTRKRPISDSLDDATEMQHAVFRPIDNIPSTTSNLVNKTPAKAHNLAPLSANITQVKDEPESSPISLNGSQPKRDRVACSSDTEDDSQAVTISRPGYPDRMFRVPAPLSPNVALVKQKPACSSDTEDEYHDLPVSSPSLPTRPIRPPPPRIRREPSTIASPMRHIRPQTERPAKFRRLSIDVSPNRVGKLPISTPRNVSGPSKLYLVRTEGAPARSLEGKERELDSTPLARTTGQTRMDDYSAFKGRGRYGKTVNADTVDQSTINARFEINPTTNAGKDFQYEEVVRNKEERRKLHAGDCECCRDYYNSVGPLPERPQQPLWSSPSKTPQRPCLRASHDLNDPTAPLDAPSSSNRSGLDTISHKKQISRHRYAWERAKTPPGFWDIGFPSTQEVKDINERAEDIHKKKRDAIDREAASGSGRYRRK